MKLSDEDRTLLAALDGALAEAEATPAVIKEMGYAAFSWRAVDGELADLIFDSQSTADLAAAAVRSEQARVWAMTYGTSAVTIELEVHDDQVVGQLIPAGYGDVTVLPSEGAPRAVAVDDLGCFAIAPLPTASFRLRVGTRRPVSTPWIDLGR